MALQWGDDMQTVLGNFPPTWNPGRVTATWHTDGLPIQGPEQARKWATAMPYDVEHALAFAIDQQPWVVRQGARWQTWPRGGDQPWQLSLKCSMGSPTSAPVVVRELWHARGELNSDDLEGLVSVLPLGGSATLHSGQRSVYIPRSTALSVPGQMQNPTVPAAAAVRWRGTQETRTRTILVMTAGEGRWWRGAPPPASPGGTGRGQLR